MGIGAATEAGIAQELVWVFKRTNPIEEAKTVCRP